MHFVLKTENEEYHSEETMVHPIINPLIYLNCPDQLVITWPSISQVSGYRITNQETLLLDSVVSDTVLSIDPNQLTSEFLSIQPVFNDRDGLRGYALNYQQQGAGCYLTSFLVNQTEFNTVNIDIQLNGLFLIKEVNVLKKTPLSESVIAVIEGPVQEKRIVDSDLETWNHLLSTRTYIDLRCHISKR